jgi:hypothetical protein
MVKYGQYSLNNHWCELNIFQQLPQTVLMQEALLIFRRGGAECGDWQSLHVQRDLFSIWAHVDGQHQSMNGSSVEGVVYVHKP